MTPDDAPCITTEKTMPSAAFPTNDAPYILHLVDAETA